MTTEFNSIEEVRAAIDEIDREVLHLLGRRFTCAKEIVRFKDPSKDGIIAIDRYNAVLAKRRELAIENGLDPDIIEMMYKTMMDHFIEEEMKLINK